MTLFLLPFLHEFHRYIMLKDVHILIEFMLSSGYEYL